MEFDTAGNELAWNIYGPGADEILWRYVAGIGHLRYQLDRMNNVRFITDTNGNPLEKYTYDSFGWPTVVSWVSGAWDTAHPRTGSLYGNRFMFAGREFFGEMGIMDFRHRWYHPALGRFLQPDPMGFGAGDLNLFRYCGGDPVNQVDPSGMIWGEIPGVAGGIGGGVIGAVGGFSYGVADQIYSSFRGTGFSVATVGRDTLRGAGIGAAGGALVASTISADPFAISEAALADAAITGMIGAAVANHESSPEPAVTSNGVPLSPIAPTIPPYLQRPVEKPPVVRSPDGNLRDADGNLLPPEDGWGNGGGGVSQNDLFSGHPFPFSGGSSGSGSGGADGGGGIRFIVRYTEE